MGTSSAARVAADRAGSEAGAHGTGRPLAAFGVANYRRFTIGQTISLIGSWTETVAQAVLVLRLTHSGVWLGLGTAARYAPVLVFTPYAGVIVDRRDKRRILLVTQSALAVASLVLGLLVVTGAIRLWMVFAIALVFGVATALDNPARLAFVTEMVGRRLTRNAITLNSTLVNVGRGVGPIVAATLVATVGVGWCFVANAASFGAVICSLLILDVSQLHPSEPVQRLHSQLRQGVAYARTVPEILAPVCMMVLIGTFTYEYEVSLPLFARGPLHGGATTYSLLMAAFGVGSVVGGLYCIRRPQTGVPRLIRASLLYAAAMLLTALTTQTYLAIVLLIVVGVASITFLTTGNSTIQIAARPDMRGRVIALWSTALVGSTPVGATIIGAVGDSAPRFALILGAAACAAAAALAAAMLHRAREREGGGDGHRFNRLLVARRRAGQPEGMNKTSLLGDKPVNRIGFGAMQLAGPGVFGPPSDPEGARRVLRRAIELGVDHIDTSQFYGPDVVNELIRDALYPYPPQLKLATKVGGRRDEAGGWLQAQSPAELRSGVEDNLRTLRLERIDLVNLRLFDEHDPEGRLPEQLGALADMRQEGKLDLIGISNAATDTVRRALELVDIACVQNAYSVVNRVDEEGLVLCEERKIAFVPFFPLGSAFAGGPGQLAADPAIAEVADRRRATPSQIALAWLLHRSERILLIPGTSSIQHLEENLAADDVELDEQDMQRLEGAAQLGSPMAGAEH